MGWLSDLWDTEDSNDDLSGWLSDLWASGSDNTGIEFEHIIAALGGLGTANGWFGDNEQEKVGYQGKIPDYTAVRQQVPTDWDSDRRPGEGGQRYFTDMVYAQKPDTPIPTLAQANATTAAQQQELEAGKNSFASGGIVSAMEQLRNGSEPPQRPSMPPQRPSMPPQRPSMPPQRPSMPPQRPSMPPQRPSMPPQAQGIQQAGRYLNGPTDGMGDKVNINAADGEFVVPADVVGHLGNGNSDAGAGQLENMMERIRQARTGNPNQGKQINPNDFTLG